MKKTLLERLFSRLDPNRIPDGYERLPYGTRLREGDRFQWVDGWPLCDICEDGNYAASPYTYIRRKTKNP